jgi:hypothetical protein
VQVLRQWTGMLSGLLRVKRPYPLHVPSPVHSSGKALPAGIRSDVASATPRLSVPTSLSRARRRAFRRQPALRGLALSWVSVQHHLPANASSHRLTQGPLPSGLDSRQPQKAAPVLQPQATCACSTSSSLHTNSMSLAIRLQFCWPDQMTQSNPHTPQPSR